MKQTLHTGISFAALLLITAGLLWACGWESRGRDRIEEMYPAPQEDGDLDEEIPEDELGEIEGEGLAGTWALMLKLDGEMAPIGEVWGIELTGLYLAEINQDETEMTLTFCDQISDVTTPKGKSDFGRTAIPEAMKIALGKKAIRAELPGDGTLPALKLVSLWGLELDDPVEDDISDMAEKGFDPKGDKRVLDEDDDDKPGVTMQVLQPAGVRYMVQRAFWDFGSAAMSENKQYLEGKLSFSLEEIALGAEPALLATVAPITEKADDSASRYVLRRLSGFVPEDGGDPDEEEGDEADGDDAVAARLLQAGFTCESLIENWRSMFKDR